MKAFRSAKANQPKQKGKKGKERRRHENKEKPGQTHLPIRAHALLLQPRRNDLGVGFPPVPAELVVREVRVPRDEREQPHAAVLWRSAISVGGAEISGWRFSWIYRC